MTWGKPIDDGNLMAFVSILLISMVAVLAVHAQESETDSSSIPLSVKARYSDVKTAYWEVLQISDTGLFDEPESLLAKFYVEKPDKMIIVSADREIFVHRDTVWIYVPRNKQIQRSTGEYAVNPLDFIAGSSENFEIKRLSDNKVLLTAINGSVAPDSVVVTYDIDGKLRRAEYKDPNEQHIRLEFRKESFKKKIPAQAFYKKINSGIQIIDLDRE